MLLLFCAACQNRADERLAHRSQYLLDEADLLMDSRRFDEAYDQSQEALQNLLSLHERHPHHVDIALLTTRAHLTSFLAKNARLIATSPIDPQTLFRIPSKEQYEGYLDHVTPAHELLVKLSSEVGEEEREKKAFIHGNLAAVYRFEKSTAHLAEQEYAKVDRVLQGWLAHLKANPPTIGSNKYAMMNVRQRIRDNKMAQAEVSMLSESWLTAVDQLKEAMAGDDFKFFTTQFGILEKRRAQLEAKLAQAEGREDPTKSGRLLMMVKNRVAKRSSKTAEVAGASPYETELNLVLSELSDIKNNLLYRIICLHRLGRYQEREISRATLRSFYPELDQEMSQLLQLP